MDNILIIDDVKTDRELLGKVVQGAGYQVVYGTDGEEALAKAKQSKPRIIFLDVVMPRTNGYVACRQLKADDETKHIPVVLVTSKGAESDRFWSQKQGANELVAKPYTPEAILAVLKRFGG